MLSCAYITMGCVLPVIHNYVYSLHMLRRSPLCCIYKNVTASQRIGLVSELLMYMTANVSLRGLSIVLPKYVHSFVCTYVGTQSV